MSECDTRTRLLQSLAQLSGVYPQWRLGQMIDNVAMAAGRTDAGSVWDLEDEEALAAIQRMLERRNAQAGSLH